MGKKKPTARDDDGPSQGGGGGRSKKKNLVIDDDEYSIGTEVSEESQVKEDKVAPAGGKKKGKKGNSKGAQVKDEDDDFKNLGEVEDEEDVPETSAAGKKKSKGKKGGGSLFSKVSLDVLEDEDNDKEEDDQTEEDEPVVSFAGKKKPAKGSKKGGAKAGFDLLDDENVDENGQSDKDDEPVFAGKKPPPKGSKKGGAKVSFDLLDDENGQSDEDDEPVISFGGKKKSSKGSKKGGSKASFAVLDDGEDDEERTVQSAEDEPPLSSTEKKKSSKGPKKGGSLFSASAFDAIVDDEGEEHGSTVTELTEDGRKSDDDEEFAPVSFSGKKKKSKSSKKPPGKVFAESKIDDLGGDDGVTHENEESEDIEPISFAGKKKKSSKKIGSLFSDALLDEENEDANVAGVVDENDGLMAFTGRKKSSKKKGSAASTAVEDEALENEPKVSDVAPTSTEVDNAKQKASEAAAETSKNKKKKKKSGRTAQEEEDLDKILAELGEGLPISKPEPAPAPAPQDVKIEQPEPSSLAEATGDKEGEEGVAESAAVKKKKKKKEKEKEKKAAAAATAEATAEVKEEKKEEVKNDPKSKLADKKIPKHIREMQEALARRKEAEERKKREEEERLRKEEEERRRQEELERQAEEARRRKKEKEKEKLLKKKQEGKLLTAKQKEEQRRREAMRNQFLSSKGISLPAGDNAAPAKRPIYTTKKSKSLHGQTNGAKTQNAEEQETQEDTAPVADHVEADKEDEVDTTIGLEEKGEAAEDMKENGAAEEEEDDDEEWDAKSWDDADLALPDKRAFEDEEVDSGAQSVAKKEAKKTAQPVHDTAVSHPVVKSAAPAKKEIVSQPTKSKTDESKQTHTEVEPVAKNRSKDIEVRKGSGSQDKKAEGNLRSPICCIMGHVDTGKTKLLDCIRGTNVQEGEAGGITQQIGATYFPAENIRERTRELKADAKLNVPGLLVIDTPGHESFTNLRSRGSGLCDIAILVVDIMHGLEPQTIESLNLLRMRNTEFIVALNKVDRLYGWKSHRNEPIVKALKRQTKDVQNEFNMRLIQIITQFKEQGLNTELYYKNKEMGETYSIVPTSAITGEGVPDLLLLLVQWAQKTMIEKLTFSNEIECTVLEVKVIEGHGTTIDVVLVNGILHEGDQIVVCGMQGPIVTTIRALLTPHPMKELRVKGTYLHHKEIKAAQGIKITAQGLEHAIAGTGLYVVGPDDDLEDIKKLAMEDMESVLSRIDKSGEGVCVQASTLGSLEALLEFLKSPAVQIPVSSISIGPVHKKDVMKASVMLERKKEYATILAFDVKVTPEAREYAEEVGVKIFMADIIYHLFDQFKAYIENIKEEKKREAADEAVFPCVLKIIPNCVFNKKDPIVLGVDVLDGIAKVGTPICIPSQDFIDIGRIASIENNHKAVDFAKKGQQVAIKIVGSNAEEQQKMYGRHFDIDDELVSHISRKSIDVLKANYRDDLTNEEWRLVVKLKNLFKIQ